MKSQDIDKERSEILALIEEYGAKYKKSPSFEGLSKDSKENFDSIISIFAQFMHYYFLQSPENWTQEALEDLLINIFPHEVVMPSSFFDSIEPVLSEFFKYLQENKVLKNYEELNLKLKTAVPEMCKRMKDPAYFSSVKQTLAKESRKANDDNDKKSREPSLEQWKQLYEVAEVIKRIEPWNFLWDADLVTIVLPGHEEPIYCSIMGRNGECYAIGIYPGYESLMGYYRIANSKEDEPTYFEAFDQNCLNCYYGDRKEITPKDRIPIDKLGLRFRGHNQWIYFRSMKPGYYPWYINSEQADIMIHTLQNLVMALRHIKENKIKVDFEGGESLVRFYSDEKKSWLNIATKMPPIVVKKPILIVTDDLMIVRLKKCKKVKALNIEFDQLFLPTPIQEEKDSIPYLIKMILLADKNSALLIDQHIADKNEKIEDIVIGMIARFITMHGRPSTINVRDERTGSYLQDLCNKLDIKLIEGEGMPVINGFIDGLLEHLH